MTAHSKILDGLTEPQRQAVTHGKGPLLVVAGAGSGKTRVITRRVAYLAAQGVRPSRLLAVTFTNKAANEMRERIEALAGPPAAAPARGGGGAWVSTFHSLCAAMLRFSADEVGLARHFSIFDRDDQLKAVKEAMARLEIAASSVKPASLLHKISTAKNQLWTPEDFAAKADGHADREAAKVYKVYQKVLEDNAALDFDDLLIRVAELLERHEGFRDRWQARFDFVLIDEYQDTNRAQYLIARALAAPHRNLCATGDADQAIYGWRGADIRNILDFQKDYPDAVVVKLEQNYRSTQVILDAANSLILHNAQRHERDLWTEREGGVPLAFHLAQDAEDEAAAVRDAIRERLARGRRLRDFAVFYRTNAQSRAFEEALGRARLPHRLIGAVQFYARQEIKDFLAFLRILVNERDALSLQRIINVPPRGLGGTSVERLKAWALEQGVPLRAALARAEEVPALGARAHKAAAAFVATLAELQQAMGRPVAELAALVLAKTGYEKWLQQPENEERYENVKEFLNRAALYDGQHPDGSLESFLQEIALVSDVDNLDERADAVTLMTLHAAKGLEFPIVFLTGLEDGLLPHANAIRPADSGWGEDRQKVEEERRLCYVGMTRAKEELVLTAASDRMQFQSASAGSPSRFLAEMSPEVFDEESRKELAEAKAQGDLWGAGAHAFGEYRPAFRERPRRRVRPRSDDGDAEPEEPVETAEAPAPKPLRPKAESPRPTHGRFAVGEWVRHARYGEGQILSIQHSGNLTLATLGLSSGGKRVFALEVAPLEKL